MYDHRRVIIVFKLSPKFVWRPFFLIKDDRPDFTAKMAA